MNVIRHAQLCAIARATFKTSDDDAAWAEGIKARAARLGYSWRVGDVTKAMRAVECALRKRGVVRAPSSEATRVVRRPPTHAPLSRQEAADALASIRRRAEAATRSSA